MHFHNTCHTNSSACRRAFDHPKSVCRALIILCDENKSYINLMHAQNIQSKYVTLKAKEVVGHNPKRAINSRVFVYPGNYSCAVDTFLEVSTHLYSH